MGQSFKAVLQLLIVIACVATFFAWIFDRPDTILWTIRVGAPVIGLMIGWVLWRYARRKEILPDMLADVASPYFERDGFCFAFVPTVVQGISWMQIFFQNRYEKPCTARIVLQPPRKSFSLGRIPLEGLDVDIECDGAAFGVYRWPWPIKRELQGKSVACEIACRTYYPNGGGKLLRFREGMRAGSPGSEGTRAAVAVGLLAIGVVTISNPATLSLRLPTDVLEESPPQAEPYCEILWRPDLPTGGFPVLSGDATSTGQ